MSIDINQAVKQATAEKLGPLAAAIVENTSFKDEGSFDPYFDLLKQELIDVLTRVNHLLLTNGQTSLGLSLTDAETMRHWVKLIRVFAYGDPDALTNLATPSGQMVAPTSTTLITPTGVVVPKPDPNGANSCFVRGCGQKFVTFHEAMAHKCLVHGYNQGRWTTSWARDFMSTYVGGVSQPVAAFPDPAVPDPALVNQTNLWTPTLHLDLNDLDLAPGEASRFAAGFEDTARFYFIRRLNKATAIKGRFVWTKFAQRFTSEQAYPGDFIVRKLAGDTKEWVGIQKAGGVWNPNYTWSAKATEPKYRFEHRYVGDHEADIEAIISNPNLARINYGKWRQECGYCGRNLTDAESRFRGIGPDCFEQKYLPSLRRKAGQP